MEVYWIFTSSKFTVFKNWLWKHKSDSEKDSQEYCHQVSFQYLIIGFHLFYIDSQNSHMDLVIMTVYLCNTMQTLLTHQPHFKVADGGKNFHEGEKQAIHFENSANL